MVNQSNLKKSSNIVRAIAHPVRLAILKYISEQGTTNVNSIYNSLKLEQSITSQNLRILRIAELVETKRDGKFIHYTINHAKIAKLNNALTAFFEKKVATNADEPEVEKSTNAKHHRVTSNVQSQAKAS